MNRYAVKAFALIALTVTVALAPAQAQSSDRMTVSIPFAFSVGGKTLEAGEYIVARTSQSGSAFLIRNVEGKGAAAVITDSRLQGRQWPTRGRLVFHSYNGEHYLAEIWMPTSGTGTAVSTSEAEERLAGGGARRELVAVRARR